MINYKKTERGTAMRAKYSFVCDAANISKANTLNALGIFNHISAQKFPWKHSRFTYVANILFHQNEEGDHTFKLTFVDEDGKEIIPPLNGEIKVAPPTFSTNIMLEINNIQFSKAGTYQIDLTIDNQHMCAESIHVHSVTRK